MNPLAAYAMCSDDECPSKKACKRNAASGTIPSEQWQLYKVFKRGSGKTLFSALEEKCDSFNPIDNCNPISINNLISNLEIVKADFLPEGKSMMITQWLVDRIIIGAPITEEDLKQCAILDNSG